MHAVFEICLKCAVEGEKHDDERKNSVEQKEAMTHYQIPIDQIIADAIQDGW